MLLFALLVQLVFSNVAQLHRFYRIQEAYTKLKDPVPAQNFVQKVDHFDATSQATFNQRFFVNDTFYKPGGPVFLCVGGEGPALTGWSVVSSIHCNVAVELAPEVIFQNFSVFSKMHKLT